MGHTHEDVDQLFSRIGDQIRKSGCESLPGSYTMLLKLVLFYYDVCLDLLRVVEKSSTPNPASRLINYVWDIKEWIQPYLLTMEGHSKYAAFRFTLDSKGHSEMHYKQNSDMPWQPEKDGIKLLSVS